MILNKHQQAILAGLERHKHAVLVLPQFGSPSANASAPARLWLEGRTVAVRSAVTHKLTKAAVFVVDVNLPEPRSIPERQDQVILNIGKYEPIDLTVAEFQQLEACIHQARIDIERTRVA